MNESNVSSNDARQHIPVLTDALVRLVDPSPGVIGVDCTLGAGGHAQAIHQACPGQITLIGMDADPAALPLARDRLKPFLETTTLVHANFSTIKQALAQLNVSAVDFVYADLGTSAMQLADAERGMSFSREGPLDMRFDPTRPTRAADLVNGLKESELADLIFQYGQEHRSKKIAKLICESRRGHRLDSTTELAAIVCRAMNVDPTRMRRGRIHPATKTFQALRIAVNDELTCLRKLLDDVPDVLGPQGRLAVISFHSIEDGIVKDDFRRKAATGVYTVITKKPISADPAEILRNPRARSARLRVVEKSSQSDAVCSI